MYNLKKLFRWEIALLLLLIIEIVVFGTINPRFLKLSVLLYSINDFICICIISLFVTFVVITGGIDISAGSIIGLISIVIGVTWKIAGINIWLTIPIALMVGALCGALNGFLIAYTGVQAMVVTLGGSFLFSGLSLVVMGLSGASAFEGISGMPQEFVNISNGNIFRIPNPLIIFLVLTIAAYFILHKTKYGRYVFLVGINKNSARYSGIDTKRIIMSTYILSGISAAIAGIVLTSYLGGSRPDLGAEMTMPIVTAVVLGGTAITGGVGSVAGTALASVIVGIMRFGLQMANVSTQYISVAIGLLLIIAVAMRSISFKSLINTKIAKRSILSKDNTKIKGEDQ
ncbi:MAG: autoinducer 2 import system permease LsrD [Clostridia bacterium BRH_c25]|nr:MAG: autoinducer 2 import system permease LsrD [Clostridia bacterium BRH_c25]